MVSYVCMVCLVGAIYLRGFANRFVSKRANEQADSTAVDDTAAK